MPAAQLTMNAPDTTETRLALEGGAPLRTAPLPPWPYFAPDEIEAVRAVLASGKANYWTGTEGTTFETEFAQYVGTRHAVALANGSVALELALHASGIGPGDDVIVPARSFLATASSAILRGARPGFRRRRRELRQHDRGNGSRRRSRPARAPSSSCTLRAGRATWIPSSSSLKSRD